MDLTWNYTMIAITASLHCLAILSTLFRLFSRWCMSLLWWDDAWAVVGLLANAASLSSVVLQQRALQVSGTSNQDFTPTGQWICIFAFPTLMWATRISILTSMVRISQPDTALKRLALCVGLAFGAMWVGMVVQRLEACISHDSCEITIAIATVQTVTDGFADILLTVLPIVFLHGVKLSRECKILIFSTFSASMVINVVTVVHAVFLFELDTSGSIFIGHIKTALSVIVCNLLVIVTFIYRIVRRAQTRLEASGVARSRMEFTTVELSQAAWSLRSCTTESSTWSFKPPSPLASRLSSVATGRSKVETIQGNIISEVR